MRKSRLPSTSRSHQRGKALPVAIVALVVAAQAGRGANAAAIVSVSTLEPATVAALAEGSMQLQDLAVLAVTVNGEPRGDIVTFIEADGSVLVDEATLRRWKVNVSGLAARDIEGRRFVPLRAIPDAKAEFRPRTMELDLWLPASRFEASTFDVPNQALPLVAPAWAGFVNYELFAYADRSSRYEAGSVEAGVSGPYGVGIVNAVGTTSPQSSASSRVTRLDAYWRYDDVARTRTLVAGDSATRAGAWGRTVRFGGFQYGTNFAVDPNLITYPLQPIPGVAVVPSTVDVLVNGTRVATQDVPPGPFTLKNVPMATGAGDVQVVVRDAFGRQQVVTQPFYASRQLLKPGLDDYTISVGAVRRDYGIDSNDYGSGMASAYWRRGLNDRVTVELRAEGDRDVQAAGAAFDFMPGAWGVLTLGGAGSRSDAGSAHLFLAGYQYQSQRFNASLRGTWASPSFRTVGDDDVGPPVQRLVAANAGFGMGSYGTVGVAWAEQRYRGASASETGVVSYSTQIGKNLSFNVSLSRTVGSTSQSGISAYLILPLDAVTSLSADANRVRTEGHTTTAVGATLQRTLPVGVGYGYRVRAVSDDEYEAGVVYGGPYGRYTAEVGHFAGTTAFRGSIAGGVGTLGGAWFASQPILDSFGLVRLDAVPDVRVYQNGGLAGRTDERGYVILTQLFAYSENRVSIEDKDVPIDVLLKTRDQRVAPYYRSGVVVDFGARKLVNASIDVRLADGRPLPPGTEVRRDGLDTVHPVGADGEVFVPDFAYDAPYRAEWPGGACVFSVARPQGALESMPVVGPVTCRRDDEGISR